MKSLTHRFRIVVADTLGLIFCVICTFLILIALLAAGCAVRNPAAVQDSKSGAWSAPPYIPDPRLVAASNTVAGIAGAVAPANPYAVLTDFAYKSLFGLAGGLSLALATARNKNATISTMAQGIVKARAGDTVLTHASTSARFPQVAAAINAATGANQSATGV